MSKKFTQESVEENLHELHINYTPFVYNGFKTKITYKCPSCGCEKSSTYENIKDGQHLLCVSCASKKSLTQSQEIAEKRLSDIGIKFKPFEYIGTRGKIITQCPICEEWKESTYNDIINKNSVNCKKCSNKQNTPYKTLTQSVVEERLRDINVDFNNFEYNGIATKIECVCPICNEPFTTTYEYIYGKGSKICRRCQYLTSTDENELKDFIKSLGFEIEENKRIAKKEIDIFIPSLNIGFEYNGTYYHNDKQKHRKYHYEKTSLCHDNGIRLIHIWDYEWLNNNHQIKSYIKAQLGLCEHRIYARNCEIREISLKEVITLLDYHQQKITTAKHYIGLFHNNELVLTMLFGYPYHKNVAEWEVKREICKEGYLIIGGKSKVFNYFVRKYSPKSVVSYVDRNKFTGKSYQIMGFTLHHIINERSDWVEPKTLKFIKRSPAIHKKMKELYDNNKMYRIYDSGRYCFLWKKDI
jgi:very-short-patch-repair endonuclease